jgi:hypothetical protein
MNQSSLDFIVKYFCCTGLRGRNLIGIKKYNSLPVEVKQAQ